MTQKLFKELPRPEGVAAGGTATFRIPTGRRIHALFLEYNYNASTQNVADFEEIRIYANGQVFQRISGTHRDRLNRHEGRAASQGVLEIPFDRKGMLTLAGRENTAINTGVADSRGVAITSMYMEIDLNGDMTIAPDDLRLSALESDAVAGGPGTIPFIRMEQRNPAGESQDFQISDLINPGVNAPDKVALARVTFVPSAGSIRRLKIDRNSYNIFDRSDAMNRTVQGYGIRTPQAGYYSIDSAERGVAGELINLTGITDFRYRLDVSQAMTLNIISEYHGVLPG